MLAAGISDIVVADTNSGGEVVWISGDNDLIEVAGTGDGDIIGISDSSFGKGDVMGISSDKDAVLISAIGDGVCDEHMIASCVKYSETGSDAPHVDGFKVNAPVSVL